MPTTDENGRVHLTVEEALARLAPEGDSIHTFVQGGPALIGADWPRQAIEDLIREKGGAEETGDAAQAMGHGLAVMRDDGPLFIEADGPEPSDASPEGPNVPRTGVLVEREEPTS